MVSENILITIVEANLRKEEKKLLELLVNCILNGEVAVREAERPDRPKELEQKIAKEKQIRYGLNQVQTAIKKIKHGTWGICEECQKPIEPKRLEANPVVQLCMSCNGKTPVPKTMLTRNKRNKPP